MFVQTRSSVIKGENANSFEMLVFKKRKNDKEKEKETVREPEGEPAEINKKEDKMDMKKLRYEVIKFGTSGLHGSDKEESRMALAVALGAKPQKRKYRNYAEILKEKKTRTEVNSKVNNHKLIKQVPKEVRIHRKGRSVKRSRNLLSIYAKIKRS